MCNVFRSSIKTIDIGSQFTCVQLFRTKNLVICVQQSPINIDGDVCYNVQNCFVSDSLTLFILCVRATDFISISFQLSFFQSHSNGYDLGIDGEYRILFYYFLQSVCLISLQ